MSDKETGQDRIGQDKTPGGATCKDGEAPEVQTLDLPPGAVPGGLNFGQILSFLPLVMPIIQGLISGSTEIPAFKARILGKRKEIGPIPVRDA